MTKPGTTIENGWYLGRVVDPFGASLGDWQASFSQRAAA